MSFLPRLLLSKLATASAILAFGLSAHGQLGDAVAAEAVTDLDIQSDYTTFDESLGVAKASGDVIIKYGEVTIEADNAEFHQSSGKVFARGNVSVFKPDGNYFGEEIIYNTETGEMTSLDLRGTLDPIFYEAGQVAAASGDDSVIEMGNGFFTTHDSANPNYRIEAKRMRVFPGEKVTMKGVKLYAGEKAIFWLPYLSQPLDDELGYFFMPGYNSTWGAFVQNQYGFMIGDHTLAQAHLDYRSDRGVAGGIEFKSERHRGNENFGRLNLYYAQDQDPLQAFSGRTREEGAVDQERYRINLQHRVYLPGPEKSTLYLDIDINKLSDEFFYEDFFPAEYRTDPQPDNVLNLVKRTDRGTFSLTHRSQLNDFFQSDERTEAAIDVIRTPIGETGLFYNGYTTVGVIDEFLGDNELADITAQRDQLRSIRDGFLTISGDELIDAEGNVVATGEFDSAETDSLLADFERQLENRGYGRFDTYHEFLFPTTVAGFLNVVPRAGAGYTNYSDIEAPGTSSFDRATFHAGNDISFKLSRKNADVSMMRLELTA